jgi:putative acetyltransferase
MEEVPRHGRELHGAGREGVITIRPYRSSDAAALAEVFHHAVSITGARYYAPAEIAAWLFDPPDAESIHAKNSDGRLALVAANDEDHPVAWIDLEGDGHIDMLFCDPDWTGKGIASRLYSALEHEALRQGITHLTVEASEGARPVFAHWGFATLHRREVGIGGIAIHNYAMSKALAP